MESSPPEVCSDCHGDVGMGGIFGCKCPEERGKLYPPDSPGRRKARLRRGHGGASTHACAPVRRFSTPGHPAQIQAEDDAISPHRRQMPACAPVQGETAVQIAAALSVPPNIVGMWLREFWKDREGVRPKAKRGV